MYVYIYLCIYSYSHIVFRISYILTISLLEGAQAVDHKAVQNSQKSKEEKQQQQKTRKIVK